METMNSMTNFLGTSGMLEVARQRRVRLEGVARRHRLVDVLGARRRRRGHDPGGGGAVVELPLGAPSLPRPVEAVCTAA